MNREKSDIKKWMKSMQDKYFVLKDLRRQDDNFNHKEHIYKD